MKAEILSIGDEILIGQITNTNSVWMAQQLNLLGIKVNYMSTISDSEDAILKAFEDAQGRADVVLITGGLGPTKDDITKTTIAKYFNVPLVLDEEVLKDVSSFFTKRGRVLTQMNKDQALVPEGCTVIRNKNGTAPAMWLQKENTIFISMPGVPYEMKPIMEEYVLPQLKKLFKLPFIYHKTVLTHGLGESFLAERIEDWENNLAAKNIKLAYLPQPGIVRLRLSTSGTEGIEVLQKNIEEEIKKLQRYIDEYIYGYEEYGQEQPTLEKIVSELLKEKKKTVSIAESCTGGYVSSLFTSISGSSEIFKGGIVPYCNEAKHDLLEVNELIFKEQGAVSEQCVIALAEGAIKKLKSDYSIAISGVAGPSGGTPDKPVGFVWVAVSNGKITETKSFQFGDHRG
ncbi:MAG: competence/damage-inducible protein A, partial [Bacteroidia bacterium]|nr:competence/damage-inducible protein A [Bacteroidia bacterium]